VTIRAGKQARAARWAAQRYQTLWPLRESNPKRPFGPRILKPRGDLGNSPGTEKTSPIGDPSRPEKASVDHAVGQSRGNEQRLAALEAAIANVTRLLAKTDDVGMAAELVAERRAMREELDERQRAMAGNVVALDPSKRRGQ
jgi:hypothetical protein